jgi:integrase
MLSLKPVGKEFHKLAGSEIAALTNEWRASVITRHSASTAHSYTHALDHYLRYLEDIRLTPSMVTTDDIALYATHCRAHCRDLVLHQPCGRREGATAQSPCVTILRVRLTALRSFYDMLTARGVCDANPLRGGVRLSKLARGEGIVRPSRPAPKIWMLTKEQAAALASALDHASARDRLLVALLFDTGLSAHELCALRLRDITLRGQTLTVTQPWADASAHDALAIVCSPVTAWLYRRYLRARAPAVSSSEALLLSQSCRNAGQGIGVSMVNKTLRRIGRAAGVTGVTAHNLRLAHTLLDAHTSSGPMEWLDSSPAQSWAARATPRGQLLSALFAERRAGRRASAEVPHA